MWLFGETMPHVPVARSARAQVVREQPRFGRAVLGEADVRGGFVQVPLRLVEVAGVDAGPGRAGGVLGSQCVQGPEEAFADVALLQFQNAVVPTSHARRDGRRFRLVRSSRRRRGPHRTYVHVRPTNSSCVAPSSSIRLLRTAFAPVPSPAPGARGRTPYDTRTMPGLRCCRTPRSPRSRTRWTGAAPVSTRNRRQQPNRPISWTLRRTATARARAAAMRGRVARSKTTAARSSWPAPRPGR